MQPHRHLAGAVRTALVEIVPGSPRRTCSFASRPGRPRAVGDQAALGSRECDRCCPAKRPTCSGSSRVVEVDRSPSSPTATTIVGPGSVGSPAVGARPDRVAPDRHGRAGHGPASPPWHRGRPGCGDRRLRAATTASPSPAARGAATRFAGGWCRTRAPSAAVGQHGAGPPGQRGGERGGEAEDRELWSGRAHHGQPGVPGGGRTRPRVASPPNPSSKFWNSFSAWLWSGK